MDENSLIVLVVENSVDHVTYEQLQFELTSDVDVLCDIFVRLGKDMTDY